MPLPKAPPTGKTAIFLTNGVPADTGAEQAFSVAVKSFGWTTSTISYDQSNPATFDASLTNALAKHPYVVAEAGTPTQIISPSVVSAYAAAKVPIVVDGVTPCQVTKVIIGCVGNAAYFASQGIAAADWFVADSGGKGKAVVQELPGFPVLAVQMSAFVAEVKKLCPGCTLDQVSATLPQLASGGVVPEVVSALRSHPSYSYLIFSLGDFAVGINSAIKAAGLSGIKIAGVGVDPAAAAALRAGTQTMWTGESYYLSGFNLADAAARWSVGAPGTGKDAIQPDQVLTKANVGHTSNWSEPSNALAQLQKLWKVPVTACTLGCS